MALRIGKNKSSNSPQSNTPPDVPASVPISHSPEDFSDFSNIPSESSAASPGGASSRRAGGLGKGSKKGPPVPLMGALGVLLVIGIGAGAYSFMNAGKKSSSTTIDPGLRPAGPGGPGRPGMPPGPPTGPSRANGDERGGRLPMPGGPDGARPDGPPGPGRPVQDTGLPGSGTAPVLKRPMPGGQVGSNTTQAPAKVVPAVEPTPIYVATPVVEPLPGAAPGVLAKPNSVRYIAPPSPTMLQLKKLWETGKEAKANNDIAGARKAWTEALAIASRNPALASSARGFRESLAKLPVDTAPKKLSPTRMPPPRP